MVKAITGGAWGDEGKGKVTDLLAGKADIVVRFQGGANAGHTIINDYGKFVLHMLPSGVFHKGVVNVLSSGVALNLDSLFSELETLKKGGVPEPELMISERAQLIMPYHILFDRLEEERLGKNSFGSTKSGIAPFYSDKALKIGFQVSDIFENDFKDRLKEVCEVKSIQLAALYNAKPLNAEEMYGYLVQYRDRLAPYIGNAVSFLHKADKTGKVILLEGQLGALRDIDNGIYPFVTSSSPLAGYGTVSAGIPPYSIKEIVAVIKAYSTCVGAGAFVGELSGDVADELRHRGGDGGEYGATTGRPRRMGWFDAVACRYGCMVQGATEAAITNLDVLSYLDTIPVCTGYEIDGVITDEFPVTSKLNRAKPVYEYLDGWKTDIRGIKSYMSLPAEARAYVEFIEKELDCPIRLISNGPKREDIIIR